MVRGATCAAIEKRGTILAMRDVRDAFETLGLELMDHPDVEVLECDIAGPADLAQIDEAEQALGHSLPSDVRAFYLAMDGVRLRWVHRLHPYRRHVSRWDGDVPRPERFRSEWNHLLDEQRVDGLIAIRSVHETFASDDPFADGDAGLHPDGVRTGNVTIDGLAIPREDYYQRLRVFDAYGSEGGAAFVVGAADYPVIQGSNSGASFEDGHLTDFRSYLRFLLASVGLVSARNHFYSCASGESRRRIGATRWSPSDYAGVLGAYLWHECEPAMRRAWEIAAESIVTTAAPSPCPTCQSPLRYVCDLAWIDATHRRLWLWCGVCRRYATIAVVSNRILQWPSASFDVSHPSLGYWLDHANAAWSRSVGSR